jgi:hypothetical protein
MPITQDREVVYVNQLFWIPPMNSSLISGISMACIYSRRVNLYVLVQLPRPKSHFVPMDFERVFSLIRG